MIKVAYAGLAALGCGVIFGGACLLPLEGAPTSSSSAQGSGGQGGDASGAGGATGTGGVTATTSTGSDDCAPGTKRCSAMCVTNSDPATGCAGADCAPCSSNHATPTCSAAGACAVMMCESGHADCNSDASDGCEIDTTSDVSNCNSCKNACPSPTHTTVACVGGQCGGTCAVGFDNCNAQDGCETAVSNDAANCGSCQRVCAGGGVLAATCAAGLCNSTCLPNRGNCSRPAAPVADDGCETDLTLVTSCGACGNACPAGFNCNAGNCGCALNDANCNDGAPTGTFQCLSTAGADLCKCGNTVCAYGQRCKAGGVCG